MVLIQGKAVRPALTMLMAKAVNHHLNMQDVQVFFIIIILIIIVMIDVMIIITIAITRHIYLCPLANVLIVVYFHFLFLFNNFFDNHENFKRQGRTTAATDSSDLRDVAYKQVGGHPHNYDDGDG